MACLFIGQLPFSKFFDADVYDLLEPYGKVVSVRMQHVKGEAFVYFDSVNSADAAIAALHGRRTLKGRQRPLQLFYASSSAEWSWFGILHNTRLHHLNPKVELPPFFTRKPPLATSQWNFVPNPTAEATELVLPGTLQLLQAAAAHAAHDGDSDEQKSSSSSLRTTTSSSSFYSHDSSIASSGGTPSLTHCRVSQQQQQHRGNSNSCGDADTRTPDCSTRSGSRKKKRHHDKGGNSMGSNESSHHHNSNSESSGSSGGSSSGVSSASSSTSSYPRGTTTLTTTTVAAAPLAGAKRARTQPRHVRAKRGEALPDRSTAAVAGGKMEVEDGSDGAKLKAQKVAPAMSAAATGKEESEELHARHATTARATRRGARTHRKTKLRIEDEENFAVLGDADADADAEFEDAVQHHETAPHAAVEAEEDTHGAEGGHAAQLPFSLAQAQHILRGLATSTSSSSGGGGGSGSADGSSGDGRMESFRPASAAPFLSPATAPFKEAETGVLQQQQQHPQQQLQRSVTAAASPSLSATFSSLDEADAVGTKNVVIRRRRTKAVSSNSLASLSSTSFPSPATMAAVVARPSSRAVLMPHHFHHHASHSPHSSPPSLSITPGDSTTSTNSTSHDLTLMAENATSTPSSAVPSPMSLQTQRRPPRLTTPHHYHHHHHHHHALPSTVPRGAILPDESSRSVRSAQPVLMDSAEEEGGARDAAQRSTRTTAEDSSYTIQNDDNNTSSNNSVSRSRGRGGRRTWELLNAPVLTSEHSTLADAQAAPQRVGEAWAASETATLNSPPARGRALGNTKGSSTGSSPGGGRGRGGRGYRQ